MGYRNQRTLHRHCYKECIERRFNLHIFALAALCMVGMFAIYHGDFNTMLICLTIVIAGGIGTMLAMLIYLAFFA